MSAIRRMEAEDWDLIERLTNSAIQTNVPMLSADEHDRALWLQAALRYAREARELLSEPSDPQPSMSP